MTRDEAMDKVRKLLALAGGSSGHEAASAAAMAQQIMSRYELDEAALDTSEAPVDDGPVTDESLGESTASTGVSAAWKGHIAAGLARANACKCYWDAPYGGKKRLHVVGKRGDSQKVGYLFQLLVGTVEQLAKRDCRGRGQRYYHAYRLGMSAAIQEKLVDGARQAAADARAAAAQPGANPQALVRVDRALARHDQRRAEAEAWMRVNLNTRKAGRASYSDAGAHAHGYQVGRAEVNVNGNARAGLPPAKRQIG